jgi:N-acetylmuramoyl-L-alanine amidase
MKIALSSGHGKYIRGARGNPVPPQLDEVDQARRVVDRVAELLKKTNVGIVTFHDDTSHSQNENLNTIVAWHNKQTRDYDVSCHFNAYNHSAHGTEVLYVSQQTLAKKVCDAIVGAGHFTNRGAKYNGGLAFLNGTNKPAILLEVCFCDNTGDSNLFNQHFDAICEAIAESIGGEQVPDERPPTQQPPEPEPPPAELHVTVAITAPPGVIVNVTQSVSGAAPQDVSALQRIPSES